MTYDLDVRQMGKTYATLTTDDPDKARRFYLAHYTKYDNCIVVHQDGKRIQLPECWSMFGVNNYTHV